MRMRATILIVSWSSSRPSAQTAGASHGTAAGDRITAAGSRRDERANCPELANALTGLIDNDARRRDWAQLARYREANKTLAAPAAGENRVVFMGDSITDAWPQPRFGTFFPGKPYVGRGISGQTTPQMLVRFRPDVIDLKPKVVVILAGTNDIAGNTGPMTNEEIQGNLASMASSRRPTASGSSCPASSR